MEKIFKIDAYKKTKQNKTREKKKFNTPKAVPRKSAL